MWKVFEGLFPPAKQPSTRLPKRLTEVAHGAQLAQVDKNAQRSERHINLALRNISYTLRRSARRRSIGFSVSEQGLLVSAPQRTALHHIEAALQEKSNWIVTKLDLMATRAETRRAVQIDWSAPDVAFGFLGQKVAAPLAVMRHAEPTQRERTAAKWIMAQARLHFEARVLVWAGQMGLRPSKLRLSGAKTRWGSASSKGVVSLHWRLMHFRPEVIDYVIVHELAHLRHMDHSPRFWALVEAYVPDYKRLRVELKTASPSEWT